MGLLLLRVDSMVKEFYFMKRALDPMVKFCDSAPFFEWVTSYGFASQCGPPEVGLGRTASIRRYVCAMSGAPKLYQKSFGTRKPC
jgi:hypothetical protein